MTTRQLSQKRRDRSSEFRTRLRGAAGGYDVYVSRPNGSDLKIGCVRKVFGRPVAWEVVRNGRVIHSGSVTRKHAVIIAVNAWVASQ